MKLFVVDATVAAKSFIPEEHSFVQPLLVSAFANKVADLALVVLVADFLKG